MLVTQISVSLENVPGALMNISEILGRFQSILQSGGLLCVNSSIVDVTSARSDIEVLSVPTSELAEKLGTIKVANMVMLGAFIKASDIISYDFLIKNLTEILGEGKSKLIKLNKDALEIGYNYV